jgi:hypothetical protein
MAMRDPGTPGRNPFFDHGAEPEPEVEIPDPYATAVDSGEPSYDEDPFADGPYRGPGAFGLGSDPLGTFAALIDALQGAQPEATEHLIVAAHELVLAVKTVVDATEAVLAAERATARPGARPAGPGGSAESAGSAPTDDTHDPFVSEDPAPASPPPGATPRSGVRRIDLA